MRPKFLPKGKVCGAVRQNQPRKKLDTAIRRGHIVADTRTRHEQALGYQCINCNNRKVSRRMKSVTTAFIIAFASAVFFACMFSAASKEAETALALSRSYQLEYEISRVGDIHE